MGNDARKVVKIVGWAFAGLGIFIFTVFLMVSFLPDASFMRPAAIIPLLFVIIGIIMLVLAKKDERKEQNVRLNGIKRICKIYDLIDSNNVIFNNQPAVNLCLRFVDERGLIQERIAITNANAQTCPFSRGRTIDAYEYQDSFIIDEKSVRNETLDRENELMSEKPFDISAIYERTTQKCKTCGATYPIVKDTTNQCPYCGTYN